MTTNHEAGGSTPSQSTIIPETIMEALLVILTMAQGITVYDRIPVVQTPRPVVQTSIEQKYFRSLDNKTTHSWVDATVFLASR